MERRRCTLGSGSGPGGEVICPALAFVADMEAIMDVARRYNLAVVQDAAHAPGSRDVSGRHLGTIGDVGCFSFFSNKNFTTGEGGMVVTNGDEPAEKIRRLSSHGMTTLTLDGHRGHQLPCRDKTDKIQCRKLHLKLIDFSAFEDE